MFCKAAACSNPPIQGLSAITAQGVYCISVPGAAMRKGFCRIYEIYAIGWAELSPAGSRGGAVLHSHNPTTSQKGRSSPLQPAHTLTFWVRYARLTLRAWREARLWCARAGMLPSGEKCSKPTWRGGFSESRKRGICCTFSAPAAPVPDVLVTGQSAALSWWDRAAREELQGEWGCQPCRDQECYGLQRPVSPQ